MITKERFIITLTELKQLDEDIEGVHKALKKLDSDFGGFYIGRLSTLIIGLLEASTNDTDSFLSYWIYELDWGKKWKKGTVTSKEGKDIKLKTMDDLYNYIIEVK